MFGSWDAVFLTNCVGSTMCLALKGVLIETFETSNRSSPMMASAQQGHSGTNVVASAVEQVLGGACSVRKCAFGSLRMPSEFPLAFSGFLGHIIRTTLGDPAMVAQSLGLKDYEAALLLALGAPCVLFFGCTMQ